jgi:hypothetical protein
MPTSSNGRDLWHARRTTLNVAFREWLERFAGEAGSVPKFDSLMKQLEYVKVGGRFLRDELNKR